MEWKDFVGNKKIYFPFKKKGKSVIELKRLEISEKDGVVTLDLAKPSVYFYKRGG